MKKLKKSINKEKKNYKKYNINSKTFNISSIEIQTYIAILQTGVVKELQQQNIINEEETVYILKQLKNKLGVK